MVGSSGYAGALGIVALFGFFTAFLAYALAPERLQGWKWLATVVLVYGVFLVPRVTVGIVDKTGGSPVKVVANVPLGAALFGSVTSTVGNSLTELFETVFQTIPGPQALPAELAYERSRLMFGNGLIRATRDLVFQDPNFRTDRVNFIHNCTMFDLMDGTISPAAFAASGDLWPLMADTNPARFSTITTGGTVDLAVCPAVLNSLNARMPAQIALLQNWLALQMNPSLSATQAATAIPAQVQAAYAKFQIGTAASTVNQIIMQNAVMNAVNDASSIVGQRINDPASLILAVGRAQAVSQTNASWINFGKVAEEALPLIRNGIEAICYALFPIIVLLLLLTSGHATMLAFKSYAVTLIWIQLWPPVYAVLNFMATTASAAQ